MSDHKSTHPENTSVVQPVDDPDRVGPYKILRVIGEGGMGVVYEAQQTDPVQRRVALKMMKLGMDTKEVVARFEAERQALAVMDHPNIAKVLDAGASATGRPYFVMDYVRGVSLTEYCDTNRLSMRARAELFIPICEAVQHAHQKGVIHRDLKPSNVLITVQHGSPVPKVIDFGIAKAIGQRLTEKTLVTAYGVAMGTPAYMSPEQAEMSGLDIDTRTDIFSLGVMLYQLLVGLLPSDPDELGVPGFLAQLVLRESTTPVPSARLSSLGAVQERVAYLRTTDPPTLRKELRRDLDWIVMKALDKDRNRRYETANALALDIKQYLNNAPVAARPPSARYRMTRFVKRNRAAVLGGLVVAAGLVLGLLTATAGFVRARSAEQQARQDAEAAQQISDFLVGLFNLADPVQAAEGTITALEILDRGAARVRSELAAQHVIRARMMHTVGLVYHSLGVYDSAAVLLAEALDIRQKELGTAHLDVAASFEGLAATRFSQGKYDEARTLYLEALTIRRQHSARDDPGIASLYFGLGEVALNDARYDEADSLFQTALRIRQASFGSDDLRVASVLEAQGTLARTKGQYQDAIDLYRRSLEIRERALGNDHLDVASSVHDLGVAYRLAERFDEAERQLIRSLGIRERVLGPMHPRVAVALNAVGNVYTRQGKFSNAEEVFLRSVSIKENTYNGDHPDLANTINNLAIVYASQDEFEKAASMLNSVVEMRTRLLGSSHPQVANARFNLGSVYRNMGRHSVAEREYRFALDALTQSMGPDHPTIVRVMENYVGLLRDLQRNSDADEMEGRADAMRTRLQGGTS